MNFFHSIIWTTIQLPHPNHYLTSPALFCPTAQQSIDRKWLLIWESQCLLLTLKNRLGTAQSPLSEQWTQLSRQAELVLPVVLWFAFSLLLYHILIPAQNRSFSICLVLPYHFTTFSLIHSLDPIICRDCTDQFPLPPFSPLYLSAFCFCFYILTIMYSYLSSQRPFKATVLDIS